MNGKYVPASIRSFDWFLEEILMKNAGWDELLSQLCEQDFSQEEREVVKLEMKLEALILFENKVKQYENYVLNKKRIEKEQRFRRERKCREAFVDLLRDLRKGGRLDLNSKFKNVYPLIREQQVTKDLIAQPGSTPLDLFRDEIVRLEDEMYSDGKEVKRLMKESNVELSVDTSYDDFVKLLSQIPRFVQLRVPDDNLRAIHKILIENIQEKLKETKKKEERHKRRLYEDFKYLLKRLGVKEGSKYDDVMLQIRGRTAYEQCENDVQRREFFDKYMERLREKREDKESERPAKVRRVDNDKEEGEASTAEE
jgi:pre-mRNA-processing factor 40